LKAADPKVFTRQIDDIERFAFLGDLDHRLPLLQKMGNDVFEPVIPVSEQKALLENSSLIIGDTGTGKTTLLAQMYNLAKKRGLKPKASQSIDFNVSPRNLSGLYFIDELPFIAELNRGHQLSELMEMNPDFRVFGTSSLYGEGVINQLNPEWFEKFNIRRLGRALSKSPSEVIDFVQRALKKMRLPAMPDNIAQELIKLDAGKKKGLSAREVFASVYSTIKSNKASDMPNFWESVIRETAKLVK
jgi:hypothetical protein